MVCRTSDVHPAQNQITQNYLPAISPVAGIFFCLSPPLFMIIAISQSILTLLSLWMLAPGTYRGDLLRSCHLMPFFALLGGHPLLTAAGLGLLCAGAVMLARRVHFLRALPYWVGIASMALTWLVFTPSLNFESLAFYADQHGLPSSLVILRTGILLGSFLVALGLCLLVVIVTDWLMRPRTQQASADPATAAIASVRGDASLTTDERTEIAGWMEKINATYRQLGIGSAATFQRADGTTVKNPNRPYAKAPRYLDGERRNQLFIPIHVSAGLAIKEVELDPRNFSLPVAETRFHMEGTQGGLLLRKKADVFPEVLSPAAITLPAPDISRYQLVLGLGENGKPISVSLINYPHALFGASTNMGKSSLIHWSLYQLITRYTPEECGLILVDPKRVEFGSRYEGLPHLICPVIKDIAVLPAVLDWLYEKTRARLDVLEWHGVANATEFNRLGKGKMRLILLVIDEVSDIIDQLGDEAEELFHTKARKLAQLARAANIQLVLASQKPSAQVLPTRLRDNFNTRICLKVPDATAASVVLGEAPADLKRLTRAGIGIVKAETVSLFQFPKLETTDIVAAVQHAAQAYEPTYTMTDTPAVIPTLTGMMWNDVSLENIRDVLLAKGMLSQSIARDDIGIALQLDQKELPRVLEAAGILKADAKGFRRLAVSADELDEKLLTLAEIAPVGSKSSPLLKILAGHAWL